MSTPYEATGRSKQKRRTRDALIAAARDLVASGITPTVEQAGVAAAISRPTAYRYFPNQRTLLAAAHPETAAETLLPADAPEDPAARLAAVITTFTHMIVETESQQRTMLRLSLEGDPAERAALYLRQGRAIGWIEEALNPLRGQLAEQAIYKLVLAIRSAVGIEALSWLTDVAKLNRDEAVNLMSWTAQALLYSAVNWTTPETARPAPSGDPLKP